MRRNGRTWRDKFVVTALPDRYLNELRHIGRLFGSKCNEVESDVISGSATYFFHVTNDRQYLNETGKVFPSHQEAVAYAAVVAGELAQDEDWEGFMIAVTDAHGRVIAKIPVRK